jgi:hypothetical protein
MAIFLYSSQQSANNQPTISQQSANNQPTISHWLVVTVEEDLFDYHEIVGPDFGLED